MELQEAEVPVVVAAVAGVAEAATEGALSGRVDSVFVRSVVKAYPINEALNVPRSNAPSVATPWSEKNC